MRVAIVGAGSWGTTLAHTLVATGADVTLWARENHVAEQLARTRRHPWALEGVELDTRVLVSADLAGTLSGAEVAILAVPSHAMAAMAGACAAHLRGAIAVSAAKGFDPDTGRTMTTVLDDCLAGHGVAGVAALSGPNIAIEVARGLPAATVVASTDGGVAAAVRDSCNGTALRFYSSDDVVGVQYAGALKNVIAIAAGVCDGIGAGDNGKAAVITRGIAEIARLAVRAGANPLTLAGLAGLGDCVVTCMSPHSRNRGLGEAIGRGASPAEALAGTIMVVEGVNATRAARLLAERYQVDMPIARQIFAVLFEGTSVSAALNSLMARGAVDEFRGLSLDFRLS